jgi:hypothetical protein
VSRECLKLTNRSRCERSVVEVTRKCCGGVEEVFFGTLKCCETRDAKCLRSVDEVSC